jgi:thiaminase/transcriptional activator TenA
VTDSSDRPADCDDTPGDYGDYATGRSDPRFTDWLRARAGPEWEGATAHRFVRELGADELDEAVFRRYLVQDYAFVGDLVGLVGHAVGEAPTTAAQSRLVDFLGTLTAEENDYFERAFDALGVPEEAYTDPETTAATRALRDLLGRAGRGGYAETLSVLVPAEWIYLSWASAFENDPDRVYLAEWVDLHANPGFESFVAWLRTELDREGAAASPRRRRRLDRLFSRTVELETAFFESAYDATAGTVAGSPAGDETSDAPADSEGAGDTPAGDGGGTDPW